VKINTAPRMTEFIFPIRVYYEDTDSGGVVYYANYLKFMERARTEYLRSLGFEQDEIIASEGVLFAVRSVAVDYLKPARFNQLLNVSAQLAETGKASLLFAQRVELAHGDPSPVLCTGRVKIACLDARTLRPTAIPSRILREVTSER
jgi:acyl-CoA thioester hydrolase